MWGRSWGRFRCLVGSNAVELNIQFHYYYSACRPTRYIIFILVTMSRVNFGYDHYALLRPTDVSALATSISECYCKQTADDYCASRGL